MENDTAYKNEATIAKSATVQEC